MSNRLASQLSFAIIMIFAIIYAVATYRMKVANYGGIGPQYFPTLLAGCLILLCALGLLRSIKQDNRERLSVPNLKLITLTAGATVLYIYIWSKTGWFYLWSFLYMFGLINLYQPFWKSKPFSKTGIRSLMLYLAVSLMMLVFAYFVFARLMGIRL